MVVGLNFVGVAEVMKFVLLLKYIYFFLLEMRLNILLLEIFTGSL